jgi:hypothetical protein
MNFSSYLCNVNQKITIMAKAEYKNLTKDYRNMNLMLTVGIALTSWRENFGANEYGEWDETHKQLTANAVAKAIGERYEGVYRVEHGGGTATVLVKYLLFIKQHDPKFDLNSRIKEIMGEKYPKY